MRAIIQISLAQIVFLAAVGCDSGPRVVPVQGSVSKGGQPIPNASITFYPAAAGRPSYGVSDEKGAYSLEYSESKQGAIVGEHKVTVVIGGSLPGAPSGASGKGRESGGFVAPSEITLPAPVSVEDKANVIDLEIP
ncbi:MAG: carboxypeptidase-like regulatory domain-containing protein [Aureliella sp.]